MSADVHAHNAGHAGGHGHDDHGHGASEIHVSFSGYLTGFILSVILTAIPFYLVMTDALHNNVATSITIMVFAAVQIVVHMIFFLHMSPKVDDGWSMMAMIFTVIIVVITLSGSLWVMYHLNTNMMPMQDMSTMP